LACDAWGIGDPGWQFPNGGELTGRQNRGGLGGAAWQGKRDASKGVWSQGIERQAERRFKAVRPVWGRRRPPAAKQRQGVAPTEAPGSREVEEGFQGLVCKKRKVQGAI